MGVSIALLINYIASLGLLAYRIYKYPRNISEAIIFLANIVWFLGATALLVIWIIYGG